MVSSRTLRCIRGPTVELAIAGLAAIIGAGCGGDTDVSACILPDPADRRPLRQEAYIKAPAEASKKSVFGVPVALSADGRTLAVGARDDPSGALGVGADAADRSQPGAGAVYIFAHDGSRWAQQAYLKPSNKYALVGFGSALAISRTGDTLIVGVPDDSNAKLRPGGPSAGSAVVFQRAGTTWSEEAYLRSSRAVGGANFGTSVALTDSGDTAVVGAPDDPGGNDAPCEGEVKPLSSVPPCPGAVTVFAKLEGRWRERTILEPPTWGVQASSTAAHMGIRVAISGDGSVVAALAQGSVLTYTGGAKWEFEASVVATPGTSAGSWLRLAMASDGRTLAVGEPESDRVEVYTRLDRQLRQSAVVQSLATRPGAGFGGAIALSASGTALAVGAFRDSGGEGGTNPNPCGVRVGVAGAAYLFTLDAGGWKERAFIKSRAVHENAYFGGSVALDGRGAAMAIGAGGDPSAAWGIDGDENDSSSPFAGAAYVFR